MLNGRYIIRTQELREVGVSAQTIARDGEAGEIECISRGVYQKRLSEIEGNRCKHWAPVQTDVYPV